MGCCVNLDYVIVLAKHQPLEFIESLLLNLVVPFLYIFSLGDLLIFYWVDHALLKLHNSLDDEVLIDDVDIAKSSFASFL